MLHWLFRPNNCVCATLRECNILVRKWPALREYLSLFLLYIYILFNKYNISSKELLDFLILAGTSRCHNVIEKLPSFCKLCHKNSLFSLLFFRLVSVKLPRFCGFDLLRGDFVLLMVTWHCSIPSCEALRLIVVFTCLIYFSLHFFSKTPKFFQIKIVSDVV